MSSRPEEFHLQALPEPSMTLSSHTAPNVQPFPREVSQGFVAAVMQRPALQMPIYPEAEMPFFTRAGVENVSGGYVDTVGVLLFVWCLVPQGVDYSQPYITPMNAKSHGGLPKAILVTAGFDMLRDVAHQYAQKLAKDGNDITYAHYPDLSHAFIQMTAHSKCCLEATQEVARLLGKGLAKV